MFEINRESTAARDTSKYLTSQLINTQSRTIGVRLLSHTPLAGPRVSCVQLSARIVRPRIVGSVNFRGTCKYCNM